MVLNKDQTGRDYNRVVGVDANFRFFRDLNVNVAGARASRRRRVVARRRATTGTRRAASAIAATCWETRAHVPDDRRRGSTTRWASCRASASTTPRCYLGAHLRPSRCPSWLRETFPHFQIDNFTHAQRRRPRVALHGLPLAVHASEQHVHRGRRQPERRSDRRPFTINSAPRRPRRAGPLRVQRVLRALEHERRGAVLVEPPLRQSASSTTATAATTPSAARSA